MAALIALSIVWAAIGRRAPRLRPLDSVVVLLVLMPMLLVLSGFGGPALNPWGFDATGRYSPPVWFALAVVLGAALGALWRVRRRLAVALCAVPLLVNAVAVASVDPIEAFQSPYWNKLPVDNSTLL